jgi:hypothetical protein
MTHEAAITTARAMAETLGAPHVVYRLPAWPAGVFSVVPRDRLLPMAAETFEVLGGPESPQRGLFDAR